MCAVQRIRCNKLTNSKKSTMRRNKYNSAQMKQVEQNKSDSKKKCIRLTRKTLQRGGLWRAKVIFNPEFLVIQEIEFHDFRRLNPILSRTSFQGCQHLRHITRPNSRNQYENDFIAVGLRTIIKNVDFLIKRYHMSADVRRGRSREC